LLSQRPANYFRGTRRDFFGRKKRLYFPTITNANRSIAATANINTLREKVNVTAAMSSGMDSPAGTQK
jgi:hypothetical protein